MYGESRRSIIDSRSGETKYCVFDVAIYTLSIYRCWNLQEDTATRSRYYREQTSRNNLHTHSKMTTHIIPTTMNAWRKHKGNPEPVSYNLFKH